MSTRNDKPVEIEILKINKGRLSMGILGTTPLILNRMSEKALRQLLAPAGKKSAAEKRGSLKHVPMEEFAASPYTLRDPKAPTYLAHLATAFKQALAGAALDVPGANRSQIARLVWVMGERLPIWGIPQIFLSVVRSADFNHTPDVRTRAILPQWATRVEAAYMTPVLREHTIASLMAAGGMIQGVGDWRPQKGSGTYGQFEVVAADDPRLVEIMETGGRAAQLAAMAAPVAYDQETEELLAWFAGEMSRRGWTNTARSEETEASPPATPRKSKSSSKQKDNGTTHA